MVRYTAESQAAVNEKWAADRAVTDHGDLTVKLTADTLRLQMNHVRAEKGILVQRKRVPCRWAVSFPDENVFTTDGKGICRSL